MLKKKLDEKLVKKVGDGTLAIDNFDFPKKCLKTMLSKLNFGQKLDFVNSVSWLYLFWPSRTVPRLLEAAEGIIRSHGD